MTYMTFTAEVDVHSDEVVGQIDTADLERELAKRYQCAPSVPLAERMYALYCTQNYPLLIERLEQYMNITTGRYVDLSAMKEFFTQPQTKVA